MVIHLLLVYVCSGLEFQELKVDKYYNMVFESECEAYHVKANYQRLSFFIQSEMIGRIKWTDTKYDFCSTTTFEECKDNSTVCGTAYNIDNLHVSVGACLDDLYLYVEPKDAQSQTLRFNYEEGACETIEENLYTQCGALNYRECDRCGDECRLAECMDRTLSGDVLRISLCLPYNITSDEMEKRCIRYKDVDYAEWKTECDDSISMNNVGVGTIILLVILMGVFLSFAGLVVWYNWKLRSTGRPPMKCFDFCPEILFPRPYTQVPPTSYYSPPSINLQER